MSHPFIGMTRRVGTDPSWTARALCRGLDPKLFCGTDQETFAFRKAREREAKQVCAVCPVREPCLDYALRYNQHGVWGGTTDEERIQIRTGRWPRRHRT
jgi:WhiB family transcriptional regulator, redox-sensing transcriptional regulator